MHWLIVSHPKMALSELCKASANVAARKPTEHSMR